MLKCSTPFGITADGTAEPARSSAPSDPASAQRLSASRLTARALENDAYMVFFRAQRLSASRLTALVFLFEGLKAGADSAQRLSASRLTAHNMPNRNDGPIACSTPFGITADGTLIVTKGNDRLAKCSTPFGITADGTLR